MNKVDLAKSLIMKNEGERAMKMFAEAAEEDPRVYDELAACYAEGLGVKADARRAKQYRELNRRGQKAVRARRIRDARIYNQLKESGWFGSTGHFSKDRRLMFQIEHCQMMQNQRVANSIKARPFGGARSAAVCELVKRRASIVASSAKAYNMFGWNKAERAAERVWHVIGKSVRGEVSYFDRLVACL